MLLSPKHLPRLAAVQGEPFGDSSALRLGEGVSGAVAATGEPAYVPDVPTDPRVGPSGSLRVQRLATRSYFAAPLIMSGRPLGVVGVESREPDAFDEETRDTLLAFVPTIAAAVVQARAFGRQETALARVRMANDAITQGLAVAKYALDSGQDDDAREAIADTLRRSRAVITELLGEDDPSPGGLRRAG